MKPFAIRFLPLLTAAVLAAALFSGCGAASSSAAAQNLTVKDNAGFAPGTSAEAADTGVSAGQNAQSNRKLVRTVDLSVESTEFDDAVAALETACQTYGGYMESRSVYGSTAAGDTRQGSFVLRIPAEQCDAFLADAAAAGNVTSRSEQVEDITAEYVDTAARVDSLKAEYDRLLELMDGAASLDEVIQLEDRLAEVRADLQSYEQMQRVYDNEIEYVSVTVELNEVKNLTVTSPGLGKELAGAFAASLTNLSRFAKSVLLALVRNWWVWLIAVLAAFLLRQKLKQRGLRRHTVAAKDAPPPKDAPPKP